MPLLAPALEVLLSCLFAVARHLGWQSAAAFGHSRTAEADSFRRLLFMPGVDELLGSPHALAAQMRPQTAQKKRVAVEAASGSKTLAISKQAAKAQ